MMLCDWPTTKTLKIFDYRMGSESYKYEYADREGFAGIYLVPTSFWGKCYVKWRAGSMRRFMIEKIFNKLPQRLIRSIFMTIKSH